MNCYYIKSEGKSFETQLDCLINSYQPEGVVVRLVFFGNPNSNEEYLSHLNIISDAVSTRWGKQSPVFSYVSQPPLDNSGQLVLEVFELTSPDDISAEVFYKYAGDVPYIVVENKDSKRVFIGGVMADSLDHSIRIQSDIAFSKIEKIFIEENIPINSIVRQWNYIEQITKINNGRQHYQEFNDSRSIFYSLTEWKNGYPAATGIGTLFGGIMLDLDALYYFEEQKKNIYPLDNTLQIAAFSYSKDVLLGKDDEELKVKTTPKFERAKLIYDQGLVYISGTAAIRGEKSLEGVGIEKQTITTLENIEYLISLTTLKSAVAELVNTDARLKSIRIYLKTVEMLNSARDIISDRYPDLPAIYVLADVCRDELLIEIEGIASFEKKHEQP